MTPRAETIIFPVKDLERAKGMFRSLLGADPVMDEPY